MIYDNINEAWKHLSTNVLTLGDEVSGTKELQNVCFTINDINKNILTIRKNFAPHYYLGELIWYASVINDVNFISDYGAIWKKLSDDGVTNNSAYGYIIQHKHGFDQLDKVIELLKKDQNSRRAVVNINYANDKVIETKDEPCTIALQFFVRDGKVNTTAIMRSNDLWTGTPYDIFYFTELQKYVANKLNLEYGAYTHFATSLHIYNRDEKNILDSINLKNNMEVFIDAQKILNDPTDFLNAIKKAKKENDLTPRQIKDFTLEKAIKDNVLIIKE